MLQRAQMQRPIAFCFRFFFALHLTRMAVIVSRLRGGVTFGLDRVRDSNFRSIRIENVCLAAVSNRFSSSFYSHISITDERQAVAQF